MPAPAMMERLPETDEANALMRNERRVDLREDARDLSEIYVAGSKIPITCLVHNVSARGALIESAVPDLPNRFILTNHSRGNRMVCEVAWRSGNMFGVRFATIPRPLK
ncbi:MAG: PilZ domain-containing protein [Rhizobiaceae bacterium]